MEAPLRAGMETRVPIIVQRELYFKTNTKRSTLPFLYCICFWWGGYCCPNALQPFKIYCALPNLGITRTWICRLNFAQMPIFFQAWGSLTSQKSQTRDSQLKVPLGGFVRRNFTPWKNPLTSAGFQPANLGSQGEHVTPRPRRPTTLPFL